MVNPTRHIPQQTNPNLWKAKNKVWFQKNDDGRLGRYVVYNQDEEVTCFGKEEMRSCKKAMRKRGKKNIGSYEE